MNEVVAAPKLFTNFRCVKLSFEYFRDSADIEEGREPKSHSADKEIAQHQPAVFGSIAEPVGIKRDQWRGKDDDDVVTITDRLNVFSLLLFKSTGLNGRMTEITARHVLTR